MHITEPLPGDKGARLAFGLDWRAYPVKGAKAERRRYADDFGATHYVEVKVAGEMIGGFAAPDTEEAGKAKLYSGAARIALHDRVKSRPAALVLLQDDQRVHLVFVARGAIRNDEVLSPEDARNRRLDIEQKCLRENLALTTFGSGASIGDVDEGFRAADLLAQKKVGRIQKLPLAIPVLIPLVFIGVVLAVGGNTVMNIVSPPAPPPHESTWQEKYAAALKGRFVVHPPRASALAPQLLALFGKDDPVRSGWEFDHADCGPRGNCSVTYLRAGGTFADFDHDATAFMRPISFERDGRHLTIRGPAVPKVAPVTLASAKDWPAEQELIDLLQTPPQRLSMKAFDLDSHGYKVMLDEARPLLPAPPGPGESHGSLILEGKWEIDGYKWQAPLLERLPENMTLESLTVSLKTEGDVGIHFVAKGKYYVQK
ncbi:hypothetical protein [Paraburkholderia phenazinium]|uniref:hypothetical protein n=1 Tax=Paraburkholderia phenazinium TaxID=60549 RepID=UPI00158C2BA0|nr:hypothetical protein [Paraburkholderia phenazinium]